MSSETVSFRWASNILVASGARYTGADIARYQKGTLDALQRIMENNYTGFGVIQGIREATPKHVIITPMESTVCNADSRLPEWVDREHRTIQVEFLPYTWGTNAQCGGGAIGAQSDEVLLHELIHAFRQIRGKGFITTSTDILGFNYGNFEEFVAILLTNIYVAKKTSSTKRLRKDWASFDKLDDDLCWSDRFFKIHKHIELVQKLVEDEGALCKTFVEKDECMFNPVRYFMHNREKMLDILHPPKPAGPPSETDLETDELLKESIAAQTYVTKQNDTLQNIAKLRYGDANQWKPIYDENKAQIGPNPFARLPAGKTLFIPPQPVGAPR